MHLYDEKKMARELVLSLQLRLMKAVTLVISRFQNFTATHTWKYRCEGALETHWNSRSGCWLNSRMVGRLFASTVISFH